MSKEILACTQTQDRQKKSLPAHKHKIGKRNLCLHSAHKHNIGKIYIYLYSAHKHKMEKEIFACAQIQYRQKIYLPSQCTQTQDRKKKSLPAHKHMKGKRILFLYTNCNYLLFYNLFKIIESALKLNGANEGI